VLAQVGHVGVESLVEDGVAGRGNRDVNGPAVGGAVLTSHQAGCFDPVNQARRATGRVHRRLGNLRHGEVSAFGATKLQQHVEPG
jgi:hypothetical protein